MMLFFSILSSEIVKTLKYQRLFQGLGFRSRVWLLTSYLNWLGIRIQPMVELGFDSSLDHSGVSM